MELKSVLSKIMPSQKEEREMRRFSEKVLKVAESMSKEFKPMFCGSFAKGTWLSTKRELDLFLLFDPSVHRKKLEQEGLKYAKNIVKKLKGKYQIAYAEHPYLLSLIHI